MAFIAFFKFMSNMILEINYKNKIRINIFFIINLLLMIFLFVLSLISDSKYFLSTMEV